MSSASSLNHKRYIVRLKNHDGLESHLARMNGMHNAPKFSVGHTYDSQFLNAYVATFSDDHFEKFNTHNDVEFIEEDTLKSTCNVVKKTALSWGLSRINQAAKLTGTTLNYRYDDSKEIGSNVNIYILDTGIKKDHNDFGTRAKAGFVYQGGTAGDIQGHGTHVAGIAGGATYGVAKSATLYEVKVLDDSGTGWTSDILKGMEWVLSAAKADTTPSVANMSYTGPFSQSENDGVKKLTDAGVHVVVAAGNDGKDATGFSPASASTAITVGSSTKLDAMRSDSNYGDKVNLLAPGDNIVSCGITSNSANATMSGTSQAAPHVTGIIATLISMGGNMTPANMSTAIQNLSIKNALSGLKPDTPNALARGCIHSTATFTVKNSSTGGFGVDSGNAILCKGEDMTTKDSGLATLSSDNKSISCTFSTSDSNTISNLVIVSAENEITTFISHGSEANASAEATFSGVTKSNTSTNTVSYPNCKIIDG